MSSSLSNLVDNLSEGLHNDKCTDCKSCLDYMSVNGIAFNGVALKDDQWNCIQQSCTKLIFKCFECKKDYKKDFNKELIKTLINLFCY